MGDDVRTAWRVPTLSRWMPCTTWSIVLSSTPRLRSRGRSGRMSAFSCTLPLESLCNHQKEGVARISIRVWCVCVEGNEKGDGAGGTNVERSTCCQQVCCGQVPHTFFSLDCLRSYSVPSTTTDPHTPHSNAQQHTTQTTAGVSVSGNAWYAPPTSVAVCA